MIHIPLEFREADPTLPDKVHFVMRVDAVKSISGKIHTQASYDDRPSTRIDCEYYRLVKNKHYGFYVLVTHKDCYGVGYPNTGDVLNHLEAHMRDMVEALKARKRYPRV